ncbi:MAG TPA: hypothetical protein VI338_03660 [Nitrososphaera sp.]|nr:hypothetical protein [Nitrososphaera sp.]
MMQSKSSGKTIVDLKKEKTPVDALRELVTGTYEETRGLPWSITKLSMGKTIMSNGLDYCFAEVSFSNGIQYGIEAFGDEAVALRKEASIYFHPESEGYSVHQQPLLIAG